MLPRPQILRQLQLQQQVELASLEREATPKKVPLPRSQLDGDFVINAMKEGYDFQDTDEGLFLVKDESFTALVIHPEAKHSREMHEVARLLGLQVDYDSPGPAIFDLELATEGRIQPAYQSKVLNLNNAAAKPEQDGMERLPAARSRRCDLGIPTGS